MPRSHKALLLATLMTMALPLTGCQALDSTMETVKQTFDRLPQAQEPTRSAFGDDDDQAPPMASTQGQSETDDSAPPAFEPETRQNTNETAGIDKTCPPISIVDDLGELHQFTNPDHPSPESRISSIVFENIAAECVYNEQNLVIEFTLTFEGKLGPRARIWSSDSPSFAYPYFIALTAPNGTVAAKEIFAATVTYDKDSDTTIYKDSLRQIIPVAGQYKDGHEILIGFQLNEGELAYNRALHKDGHDATGISEQYMDKTEPAAAETKPAEKPAAKPMTVLPSAKPEIPAAVKEATPAEKITITEEQDIIVEQNTPAAAPEPAPEEAAPTPAPEPVESQPEEQATETLTDPLLQKERELIEGVSENLSEDLAIEPPAIPEEQKDKIDYMSVDENTPASDVMKIIEDVTAPE
ncbi:MAG: hypothetical protein H6867_06875 [Rhodospirillales bacterium]|nr:hypothetical protein [Rhodospirillales bacterium]MCB9995273.1 hypothetical protein [Rhodospirillales bacterium]